MELCEYAISKSDKEGRICYSCRLYQCFIGLDLDLFCLECLDYAVCSEDLRGFLDASNV